MVPSSPTPDRVTELLLRAGRLTAGGRVVGVSEESVRTTIISTLQRLRVEYHGEAQGAPAHLLLKTARTDGAVSFAEQGRKEATFYRDVAPLTPAGLLAPCFEAVATEGDVPSHVLLEDLSGTHHVLADWPVTPALEDCERLIDGYARFHAVWWNHGGLGTTVGRFHDANLATVVSTFEPRWAAFRTLLGDRLSAERAARYERFLCAATRLLGRYRSHRDLTIVNGDAHVWNALFPNDPAEPLRLIDWAGWRIDTATDDLAYMMALPWYPERRARFEQPLLHRYHEALVRHGVSGYGYDALLDDYRLSALWQIMIPVWQATAKLPAAIWWSHFERAMLAFEDLGCEALLD
jgi:hypothetical protein